MSKVLVTGASGFVGSHCILKLLAEGHEVRGTLRSLKREPELRKLLKTHGADAGARLSFAAADLEQDAGWPEAVAGCEYVLHVASPFPVGAPKHEDELIVPARDGALRALRAARDAGVKRVVLTSSFAAIGYGHGERATPFDESCWTNLEAPDVSAYQKSKTLAERAAWDFVSSEGRGLELAVVNPVGIFGPVLSSDFAASIELLKKVMEGAMPALPQIYFGVVDVRDVADLHLLAMESPQAKGERFLASAGDCLSLRDVALVLKAHLGARGARVPTRELPHWMVRLAAKLKPELRDVVPGLGVVRHLDNEKARRLLGWAPRSSEEAIRATADSLETLG
jgi:nucleoside-diphosphate-sugar epimerase